MTPEISTWHWAGFAGFILAALALDLGLFHRKARRVRVAEALAWTTVWFVVSIAFAFVGGPWMVKGWSSVHTSEYLTGYLVELSLSMDNVFVIAVIFRYFRVADQYQHRVLFWGILGALVMRAVMILAGTALVERFHFTLYLMGGFLVFTGLKMLFSAGGDDAPAPEDNPVVRLVRRCFPVAAEFDGDRFVTRVGTVRMLTPLAIVLVMVETTDVIFALDSIPAIFGMTREPFIIFTSNVFAILGLRSLYFVLASAMGYFHLLKYGLALVLIFIGVKMLAEHWLKEWFGDRLTNLSLGFVVSVILTSMGASVLFARRGAAPGEGLGASGSRS